MDSRRYWRRNNGPLFVAPLPVRAIFPTFRVTIIETKQKKNPHIDSILYHSFRTPSSLASHCASSRRQTLPFKAFLVTFCTIFGVVTSADRALLNYERYQRLHESAIRQEARIDLARRGLLPTETEIMRWKEEHSRTPGS
jgi:hypothetical protein